MIAPLSDPVIGRAPSRPTNASESYDERAIEELMRMVALTKIIGGGVTQLFDSAVAQTAAITGLRDAQIGRRNIPFPFQQEDVGGRDGGPGLLEMATGALDDAVDAPEEFRAALSRFKQTYKLDKAFALKNDRAASLAFAAHASAQGAIAASTAEQSFKRANDSMSRINGYLQALDNSSDIKTSIDLNTRVMLEMTQQMNESLRTQAAIASVAGTYFMVLGGEIGGDDAWSNLINFNR
ncbi:type IV secretion system protein [Rhizobium sp. NFACC06-2]|uniref:type IV secretion system protein n=1 Tax=Rhizobium sp. NFACC06-2 TaxID=1566264 RepID=UPI00165F8A4D|nr:type IV secretion system protein [Rhizobium sp. NFACC06-2]